MNILSVYSDYCFADHQTKYAIKHEEERYDILRKTYGEDHKETLDSMYKLAKFNTRYQNYGEALRYGLPAYEKQREILGEDNPSTIESLKCLIEIYNGMGEKETARKFEEELSKLMAEK